MVGSTKTHALCCFTFFNSRVNCQRKDFVLRVENIYFFLVCLSSLSFVMKLGVSYFYFFPLFFFVTHIKYVNVGIDIEFFLFITLWRYFVQKNDLTKDMSLVAFSVVFFFLRFTQMTGRFFYEVSKRCSCQKINNL